MSGAQRKPCGCTIRHCGCEELSRRQLLSRGAATAGNGLPAITPGMPAPAGTGLSRRSFMLRSSGLALSVYGGSKLLDLKALEAGVAHADVPGRVLVSVFLDGGADSLSILAPTSNTVYQNLRPTLKLSPAQTGPAFSDATQLRWNTAAAPMRLLHEAKKVAVFPTIGYTEPDQSHFTSRHYWEVGELDPNELTGWMGRLIDRIGTDDNPLQGLSLDGSLSPSLASQSKPVAAIDGTSYGFTRPDIWYDEVRDLMWDGATAIGAAVPGENAGLAGARSIQRRAMKLRQDLADVEEEEPGPAYPDTYFARNLAGLAQMLDLGLPIRCVSVSANGGYDTHEGQDDGEGGTNLGQFASDVGDAFTAVKAFQDDLQARGIADRVATLVWSEFGRRPDENQSLGTDHGAAGTAFLVGNKVNGLTEGMVGDPPDMSNFDEDDNLVHTTDFRALYCSLLEQWFNEDPAGLIPGEDSLGRYPNLILP